jgi:hypothetical protein
MPAGGFDSTEPAPSASAAPSSTATPSPTTPKRDAGPTTAQDAQAPTVGGDASDVDAGNVAPPPAPTTTATVPSPPVYPPEAAAPVVDAGPPAPIVVVCVAASANGSTAPYRCSDYHTTIDYNAQAPYDGSGFPSRCENGAVPVPCRAGLACRVTFPSGSQLDGVCQ